MEMGWMETCQLLGLDLVAMLLTALVALVVGDHLRASAGQGVRLRWLNGRALLHTLRRFRANNR